MTTFTETIDVDVPVRVAYNQWTQFESFPRFMEGVDRVVQLDDTTLDWTATIAGRTKHWRAKIVEQRPDEVLAWLSKGKANRDIAQILGLSPRTVDKHLEQIYAKLGVENRTAAAAIAVKASRK